MSASRTPRYVIALLVLSATALFASNTFPLKDRLIVHEWGTFTSIAGLDGVALDWRPLNGPSELPGFIHTAYSTAPGAGCLDPRFNLKLSWRAKIRMETPVLYFYADRDTTASVKVDFPKGQITEWYPRARWVGAGIDWGAVEVLPATNVDFPIESRDNPYYAARQTDAASLRVAGRGADQHEKFLFYRGLGSFDLPLSARLEPEKVVVKNLGGVETVVLFENRGGKVGYAIKDLSQTEVALDRPALEQTTASLEPELERMLVMHGLYQKEAQAMIRTWRHSWFEEGLRVFYVVPREVTDAVLPITIEPKPAALVRILVGRMEIITPEMESALQQSVARLADPSVEVRHAVMETIRKYGRFSEPILQRTWQGTTDTGVRSRLDELFRSAPVFAGGRADAGCR